MGKLDLFKEFVKENPNLLNHVKSGEMTWQKFYELYDLYGDESDVWKDYITPTVSKASTAAAGVGFNDIINWLKNIDLDSVQSGVGNIQRVVGVLQDLSTKDNDTSKPKEEYKPRPLYKSFED